MYQVAVIPNNILFDKIHHSDISLPEYPAIFTATIKRQPTSDNALGYMCLESYYASLAAEKSIELLPQN